MLFRPLSLRRILVCYTSSLSFHCRCNLSCPVFGLCSRIRIMDANFGIPAAVFVGALTQARILGGSIGLAACTNILNHKVKSQSQHFLSSQQLNGILASAQTINALPPDLQILIRRIFADGYNEEMQALTAFGGACLLASLLMWEKKPRRME